MTPHNIPGLYNFLREYPRMAIKPSLGQFLELKGMFDFTTEFKGLRISDSYHICIQVPFSFPKQLPIVKELDYKIPHNRTFHVNDDGTLCYGSTLRLLLELSKNPNLKIFSESCLEHYFYAISHKLKYGGEFPFGELSHGTPGQLNDYIDLFGLKNIDQVRNTLNLLGMKKRLANKILCPCGCSLRLGKCRFNYKIRRFRYLANRSWFKSLTKK